MKFEMNRQKLRQQRLIALLPLLGITFLTGCGGGKSAGNDSTATAAATNSGRAVLGVKWPQISRHIPYTADRLVISVLDAQNGTCYYGDAAGCRALPFFVDRPHDGTTSTNTTLANLPVRRALTLQIKALTLSSTTGTTATFEPTPVATGNGPLVPLEPGAAATPLTVSLTETVASLQVYRGAELLSGQTDATATARLEPTAPLSTAIELRVEAKDANGDIVLLRRLNDNSGSNTDVRWSVDTPTALSLERFDGVPIKPTDPIQQITGTAIRARRTTEIAGVYHVTATYTNTDTTLAVPNPAVTVPIAVGQITKPLFNATAINVSYANDITPASVATSITSDAGQPILLTRQNVSTSLKTSAPLPVINTLLSALNYQIEYGYDGKGNLAQVPLFSYIAAFKGPVPSLLVADTNTVYQFKQNLPVNPTTYQVALADQSAPLNLPPTGRIAALAPSEDRTAVYAMTSTGAVFQIVQVGTLVPLPLPPFFPSLTGASSFTTFAVGANGTQFAGTSDGIIYGGTGLQPNTLISSKVPFPIDASNPSNELLGNVSGLASENNYLYVLDVTNDRGRVHVYNSDGKRLYTLSSPDETALKNAVAISASPITTTEGRVHVAYVDKGQVRVLEYIRRQPQ